MKSLLGEWLSAIGVLFLTLLAVAGTRALLRRVRTPRFVAELAPSLGNLAFLLGARVFVGVAPLRAVTEVWINHGLFFLTVVILLALARRAALVTVNWSAAHARGSKTLQQGFVPLFRNVINLFILLSGSIMVMRDFGYDVLSLLTALGVGSLAVGLAAKDTLSNMISGFTLIIDRNLRPGDRVNLGGNVGDVEEIGLRSSRIRVDGGNMLIVPNAELANTKILNLSLGSREVSGSSQIRVPASIPFARVKKICLDVTGGIETLRGEKRMRVDLLSIADGTQQIAVGFTISEREDANAVLSELNERLLSRLQQEGIPLVAAVR